MACCIRILALVNVFLKVGSGMASGIADLFFIARCAGFVSIDDDDEFEVDMEENERSKANSSAKAKAKANPPNKSKTVADSDEKPKAKPKCAYMSSLSL